MASKNTSRTGTTRWLNLRRRLMTKAIRQGTFACEECGVVLSKDTPPGHPLAPELDHRVRVADGGAEFDPANLRWLCRTCHLAKTVAENVAAAAAAAGRLTAPTHDANNPRPGLWYGASGGGTTGFLDAEGIVRPVIAGLRLYLLDRWWTEEEAAEEQRRIKANRNAPNAFRR